MPSVLKAGSTLLLQRKRQAKRSRILYMPMASPRLYAKGAIGTLAAEITRMSLESFAGARIAKLPTLSRERFAADPDFGPSRRP